MTLRTIEKDFAQLLLKQTEEFPLDLSLDAPLMNQLHPRLIWTKLQMDNDPHFIPNEVVFPDWYYACFSSIEAAQESFPEISDCFRGSLYKVSKFLTDSTPNAIIDFDQLGTIVLSKTPIKSDAADTLTQQLLPLWVNYALSPELWGPEGKWPRFHERLLRAFSALELVDQKSSTGYYSLSLKAQALEKHGFKGTALDNEYRLVLPWTFSLSALEKLEKVIQQEF